MNARRNRLMLKRYSITIRGSISARWVGISGPPRLCGSAFRTPWRRGSGCRRPRIKGVPCRCPGSSMPTWTEVEDETTGTATGATAGQRENLEYPSGRASLRPWLDYRQSMARPTDPLISPASYITRPDQDPHRRNMRYVADLIRGRRRYVLVALLLEVRVVGPHVQLLLVQRLGFPKTFGSEHLAYVHITCQTQQLLQRPPLLLYLS
jgi:hypothetical protein